MNIKKATCLFIVLTALSACQTMDTFVEDVNELTRNGGAGFPSPSQLVQGKSESLLASPCPQVELVDDLSSISDFSNSKDMVHKNLISRVDLSSAESTCKLSANSAIIDLKLLFNGMLGPKGKQKDSDKPFFSYPYFVAVTAPGGKIIGKEVFAASLAFSAHEDKHVYYENLRQIIPITDKNAANRYKILIGFQVSPEQLAYNRKNMVPVASAKAAKAKKDSKNKDNTSKDITTKDDKT